MESRLKDWDTEEGKMWVEFGSWIVWIKKLEIRGKKLLLLFDLYWVFWALELFFQYTFLIRNNFCDSKCPIQLGKTEGNKRIPEY